MKSYNTNKRNRYNINLLRTILKKENFYIFKFGNFNRSDFSTLKSNLNKQNIKFYKIRTHLAKIAFKENIYHNLINMIEGPILLGYSTKNTKNLLNLTEVEDKLTLLGYKVGPKFYSKLELPQKELTNKITAQLKYCVASKKTLKNHKKTPIYKN